MCYFYLSDSCISKCVKCKHCVSCSCNVLKEQIIRLQLMYIRVPNCGISKLTHVFFCNQNMLGPKG